MRILLFCIAAAVALLLGGCANVTSGLAADRDLYLFDSKMQDVEVGMSKTRVQHLMGPPRERLYQGSQEAWLWCQTSSSPKFADAFLVVHFFNAQVAGIHTYGNRAEGPCDNFFRPVEWLADPQKALAAKQKRRD